MKKHKKKLLYIFLIIILNIKFLNCKNKIKNNNAEIKRLCIAVIQIESQNGQINKNLKKAAELINEAVKKGAEFILLPEFLAAGYSFSNDIWDAAEPKNGRTVKWLKENTIKYNIWIGTSFLEAEGEDFYNTFVLMKPDGKEAGRVRKQV